MIQTIWKYKYECVYLCICRRMYVCTVYVYIYRVDIKIYVEHCGYTVVP